MNLLSNTAFLAWAAEAGLVPDPRYPGSEQLVFAASFGAARVWLPPGEPNALPHFLTAAFRSASPAGPYRLRLRGGGPFYGGSDGAHEQVITRVLQSLAVPLDATGALEFAEEEWDAVLLLAVVFYVFGFHMRTDLEIVTPDRSSSLLLSHHGELDAHFSSEARMDEFVKEMKRKGYALAGEELDAG